MKFVSDRLSKMHPLDVLFRGIILSLGLLFFAFAAWQAVGSIRTIMTYDKYSAEVKSCRSDSSPNARFSFYSCDVKYQVDSGRRSATVDKLLFSYDEGDQMDIYIGRGEQYSVRAGGFVGLWGIPTLLSVIGTAFFGFAVWPGKVKKS